MKRLYIYLLFALIALAGCKKNDDIVKDPLHKKWFLHKIERNYTDKDGNPHTGFESWSQVVDDREMYFEFTNQGQMFTHEGNGTYTKTQTEISYSLPAVTGSFNYSFQGDMLVLTTIEEGVTYTQRATFWMKPF